MTKDSPGNRPRLSSRLLHPVCLFGVIIFAVGLAASIFALVVDVFEEHSRPYQGLLTFVLYPSVMFVGAGIILFGLRLDKRRARRLEAADEPWQPVLRLRDPIQRRILWGFAGFAVIFATASMVGAFRAYEYTESEEFCGSLCHEAMDPQGIAHLDSPHANVGCVECHVGPGIGGYVSAKVSGTRQLWQTLTKTVEFPIQVHRHNLPGAEDSCEKCHRKDQFWGEHFELRSRFGFDLRNTRRSLGILFNLGGGGSPERPGEGIHWHMALDNAVTFRGVGNDLQEIPWVRIRRADGTEIVYRDSTTELSTEEIDALDERDFSCLDCHNRPAHRFLTPERAVDIALDSGRIDATLPFIKKAALAALARTGATKEEGRAALRPAIERFYREKLAGAVLDRKKTLDAAIATLEGIYDRHSFPEAKVDGFTHPDNIGHRDFPGCFRCHGGKHVSDSGEILPSDCSLCHEFFEERTGSQDLVSIPVDGSSLHPFLHPDHAKVDCWSCHDGSSSPYSNCKSCHDHAAVSHGMAFECSICHKPGNVKPTDRTCATCHPTGDSPLHAHADHGACISCHAPHSWKVEDKSCSTGACHQMVEGKPLAEHYPGKPCGPCHEFKGVKTLMMGLPIGGASEK